MFLILFVLYRTCTEQLAQLYIPIVRFPLVAQVFWILEGGKMPLADKYHLLAYATNVNSL